MSGPLIAAFLLHAPDLSFGRLAFMSIDKDTVKRVARLARLSVTEEEAENLKGELNSILDWVEMLNEVDVDNVVPMTAVVDQEMKSAKTLFRTAIMPTVSSRTRLCPKTIFSWFQR